MLTFHLITLFETLTLLDGSIMNIIKLNNFLARLKRKTPMTGVFRQTLGEFDHRKIVLVTCVGNEEGAEGYDPDAQCITGTYYELHNGNEITTHSFANDLKLRLKHMIDVDNVKMWEDIKEQTPESALIEELNRILGNGAFKILEQDSDSNGAYYAVTVDSPYLDSVAVSPSEALIELITEQSEAIVGKTPAFNNTNTLFWFN